VDDAHLLERLDDRPGDAEVGEGLGDLLLGVVGLLRRGQRLVGRCDVGVRFELVVGPGLAEGQVLDLEVGAGEDLFGCGRVCVRVQRIRPSTSAVAARAGTTRTDRGAEAGGQDAGRASVVLSLAVRSPRTRH